jgi:hypothetical protein
MGNEIWKPEYSQIVGEMAERLFDEVMRYCPGVAKCSPIRQDRDNEKVNRLLRENKAKRPDRLVITPDYGCFYIEIKYKSKMKRFSEHGLPLHVRECEGLKNFGRITDLPVWFAISNKPDLNFETWYWISLDSITPDKYEIGKYYSWGHTRERDAYIVPIEDFIKMRRGEPISKIFKSHS